MLQLDSKPAALRLNPRQVAPPVRVQSPLPSTAPGPRRHVLIGVASIIVVFAAGYGAGTMRRAAEAPVAGSFPVIAPEVVSLLRETALGHDALIETDAAGRIVEYSAGIDPTTVPRVCLDAVELAAPGGRIVVAQKQVTRGDFYYEVEKEIEGLRFELLFRPDGTLAGREDEIPIAAAPGPVLDAANELFPHGDVCAVERVVGPETLGGREYHVKKLFAGEVVRIRVTEQGAAEVLRRLAGEIRVIR
jgi:hypothetical protein